ncbi:glutathione hydrolase 5 proenzyme [Takifugu rubripes]|uniref:Glutathione hydrolase n=1 Tax=Takifugu rubripes TaxID=31033 RepID=A0A3B5K697_TAKRU|nr:glutathione hydrolase 5 proenzyme-like [Takifugu rubripes]
MANSKPWLVCCCVLGALTCLALIYLCVSLLVVGRCASFTRAAVAADSRLCSDIGRSILQQGGSAVDGAIAALLCTSVVNPQSMGIGGGSIVTVRDITGHIKVYNFRETVPRRFKVDLLSDCPSTFTLSTGSQWIGVPGELRGYEALHRRYGKLSWAKLFEPTIKLARDGIKMPPFLTELLKEPLIKAQVEHSSLCKLFCNANKTALGKGDTLKFSQLAETLEIVAQKGADAFYTGKIGQDLIKDIKEAGGTLEMDDLRSFRVREENAWKVSLGNTHMYIPPPPAGGALLAFILKLMKEFPINATSMEGQQKTQMYHYFIEAAKFANGQRRSISDPRFSTKKSAAHLIDPSFIDRIRRKISVNCTHENDYYSNVAPPLDRFGTTHVSVVDEDGLAVSATSTINQIFGGAVYSPRTGVIMNNELSDFCKRADAISAGEQPPSSMSPVILESESGGLLVIGGSGGSMITSAVALAIMNRLWLKMSLKDAIAAPIVYVDSENNVKLERGFDQSVVDGLKALRHKVRDWKYFFNVVNGLEKENGCIEAVSDKRKMGQAAGY